MLPIGNVNEVVFADEFEQKEFGYLRAEVKKPTALDPRYYEEVLTQPLPVVPETPIKDSLDKYRVLMGEVINLKSYVAELEISLLSYQHFWASIQKRSGKLFKMALMERVKRPTIAALSTTEMRNLAAEKEMTPIANLCYYVDEQVDHIKTLMKMISRRKEQLDDIFKALSRQISVIELELQPNRGF